MAEPAEFRINRRSWFCCPYCGHHAWNSLSRVRMLQSRPWMAFEGKCPRCAKVCTESRPYLVNAAIFGSLIASFPLAYLFAVRLDIMPSSLAGALLPGAIIGLIHMYGVAPLISRYLTKFSRAAGDEL